MTLSPSQRTAVDGVNLGRILEKDVRKLIAGFEGNDLVELLS